MSWFFFAGLMSLLINSFKDVKNKIIDDRWNYYCYGVVFTLVTVYNTKWYLVVGIIIAVAVLHLILSKWSGIATGDLSAFNWITIGYFLFDFRAMLMFWLIMGVVFVGLSLLKKWTSVKEFALYPFILVAFVLASIL